MSIRTLAPYIAGTALVASCSAFAGGDPIPVCIGAGGALRMIEMKEKCSASEERKLFTEWEEELDEPPDEEDEEQQALRKQVQDLSKRVASLERGPDRGGPASSSGSFKIVAPFEVVTRSGKVILRVAEKVSSTSGDGAHVTIGAGDAGNYAVRVHQAGGAFVAGVGQSRDGAGLVAVMDSDGALVANMSARDRSVSVFENNTAAASLTVHDDGGTVAVYQGKQPVAYLTRSSHGNGGNVTVTRADGFGVFSAGSASDGGGEACLNRVTGGGKERNVCLGVELPSMGLGK